MRRFRTTWIIETEASSPEEAAGFALEIQQQAHTATVFQVEDIEAGKTTLVDVGLDGAVGENRVFYPPALATVA